MNDKAPDSLVALSREAVALNRQATDIAGLCKEIVLKTAVEISGRKHVRVEGWTSIAAAYGCVASIKSVEHIPSTPGMSGGIRAIAELKRANDGHVISTAEGFVGEDEPTWYGGPTTRWNKFKRADEEITLPKRADYAIRAMAQTRAVSRVCRGPFSHVVVLMDAGLDTTPAEEIMTADDQPGDASLNGKIDEGQEQRRTAAETDQTRGTAAGAPKPAPTVPRDGEVKLREQFMDKKWEKVVIHFGQKRGTSLGQLADENKIKWWIDEWQPKEFKGKIAEDDLMLRAALDAAGVELAK